MPGNGHLRTLLTQNNSFNSVPLRMPQIFHFTLKFLPLIHDKIGSFLTFMIGTVLSCAFELWALCGFMGDNSLSESLLHIPPKMQKTRGRFNTKFRPKKKKQFPYSAQYLKKTEKSILAAIFQFGATRVKQFFPKFLMDHDT